MSNSNGKITPPISLAGDVYKVLGISPKNGVYDVGYACGNSHEKINIWAKGKPVAYASCATLTDEQRRSTNQGLTPTSALVIEGTMWKVSKEPWTYNPPKGGASEPFRLTDFDGYNHNAVPPLRTEATEITWDTGLEELEDLSVAAYMRTSGYSIGDTTNMDIMLDDFRFGNREVQKAFWGLLYVDEYGNAMIANSRNNFDRSFNQSIGAAIIYPNDSASIRTLLENLEIGGHLDFVAVLNFAERPYDGEIGVLSAGNMWTFPDGGVFRINKTYTPAVGISHRGQMEVYYGSLVGRFASSSGGIIQAFQRQSISTQGWVYSVRCTYTLRSLRSSAIDVSSSSFRIEIPSGQMYSGTVYSINGSTTTKMLPTTDSTVVIEFLIDGNTFNNTWPYVNGVPEQSRRFRLRHGGNYLEVDGDNNLYYGRVSS